MENLLSVHNLSIQFATETSTVFAVRDVSFNLEKGKTLGIVGESGCGKSVTALALLRLIKSPGSISSGKIEFMNKDMLSLEEPAMRSVRGGNISMIFQEPMTALNPIMTVGRQILESIEIHRNLKGKEAKGQALELLAQVGIPDGDKRLKAYPHELSGGMCQRILIAMALAGTPELLIADEPTTALDVTIQAQIIELLRSVQEKRNMGLILITHDLAVVSSVAHDVAIMYAGEIVEYGSTSSVIGSQFHPYTQGLFNAVPQLGNKDKALATIPGVVPIIKEEPTGCVFYPRCYKGSDECLQKPIPLVDKGEGHLVRCIKA